MSTAARETLFYETADRTYGYTSTSFIKRERKRESEQGESMLKKRLRNEAAALDYVSKHTTIAVPRLLSYGTDEEGQAYIETELLGGALCSEVIYQCWMPEGRKHNTTTGGECSTCQAIATANADRYVKEVVLPQLEGLTSRTTGLNGVVIPPPWVLEYDKRPQWVSKESADEDYVFCHGDLVNHNILMHPQTLEVVAVIDWEHAGFFPREFQQWCCSRSEYDALFTDKDRLRRCIASIEA
ncbi:hypothetical protein VTN96DRAFT_2834 [Rasamsonia emersonii]